MEISWRPFMFWDMKMHYFVFENSKNDGDIIFRFILSKVVLHKDYFLFVYIISSFINSWRYLLEINLSNSFTSAWYFFISCSWSWWKRQNLLGFLVFEPLFIRVGYNKKSFSFMEANNTCCCDKCGPKLRKCQAIMDVPLDASFLFYH